MLQHTLMLLNSIYFTVYFSSLQARILSLLVQAFHHSTAALHAVDTSILQDAVMSTAPVLADIGASPAVQEAATSAAAYATSATAATLQALSLWTMDRLAVVQVSAPLNTSKLIATWQQALFSSALTHTF